MFGEDIRHHRFVAIASYIAARPRLEDDHLDEELAQRKIFPFVLHASQSCSFLEDCRKIIARWPAMRGDSVAAEAHGCDAEIAARACLIGQPVALSARAASRRSTAHLRRRTPRHRDLVLRRGHGASAICGVNSAMSAPSSPRSNGCSDISQSESDGSLPWSLRYRRRPLGSAIPARTGSDLPGSQRWRSAGPTFGRCGTN